MGIDMDVLAIWTIPNRSPVRRRAPTTKSLAAYSTTVHWGAYAENEQGQGNERKDQLYVLAIDFGPELKHGVFHLSISLLNSFCHKNTLIQASKQASID
jgi:hypothetical protein